MGLVKSRTLKCSLDAVKRGFCRAVNGIFGKVGALPLRKSFLILHINTSKCMAILLHGLEALPPNKSQLNSLDFMVHRFLMKLFTNNDMQTIEFCRLQFIFKLPSEQIAYLCKKFASSKFVSMNLVQFGVYMTSIYFYN